MTKLRNNSTLPALTPLSACSDHADDTNDYLRRQTAPPPTPPKVSRIQLQVDLRLLRREFDLETTRLLEVQRIIIKANKSLHRHVSDLRAQIADLRVALIQNVAAGMVANR